MANKDRVPNDSKREDAWFGVYWRPAAAVIYLLICLFDFVLVPTYLGLWSEPLKDLILAIKDLPPDAQSIVLTMKLATWDPLTLKGGGLFHVAFGAILGATVWTRGQERINEIRSGYSDPNYIQPPAYSQQVDPYQMNQMQMPQQMQGYQLNNNVQNPQQPINGAKIDNPDENG
ncbi:hypothetical protein D3C87_1040910 [compost metagenome]